MTQQREKRYRVFIKTEASFLRNDDLSICENISPPLVLWYNNMSEFSTLNETGFTLGEFYNHFVNKMIQQKICDSEDSKDLENNTIKIDTLTVSISLYNIEKITIINNEHRFPVYPDYWWKSSEMFLFFHQTDNCKINVILPKSTFTFSHKLLINTQNPNPITLRIWLTQLHPKTEKSDIVFKKFSIMLTQENPFPNLVGHILF